MAKLGIEELPVSKGGFHGFKFGLDCCTLLSLGKQFSDGRTFFVGYWKRLSVINVFGML